MSSSCPNSETSLFSSEELFMPRLAPEINGWPSLSERTPANARSRSSSSKPIQQHPPRSRQSECYLGGEKSIGEAERRDGASERAVCVCVQLKILLSLYVCPEERTGNVVVENDPATTRRRRRRGPTINLVGWLCCVARWLFLGYGLGEFSWIHGQKAGGVRRTYTFR